MSKPKTTSYAPIEKLDSAPVLSAESFPVSSLVANPAIHAAAEALHNWKIGAHHLGSEMRLTKQDYDAAIKAASSRSEGKYKPHTPALFTLTKKAR